ncbi:TAXI family TRAP transporter solute-binding subunit [Methylobacterium nigriterrae]|uniref:TAXI family TRAP transporter solute-binding subunit n=1 Tax=Methylobacterium nigriterrae TaxID=3127512 RepID=UPI003013455A
MSKALRWLIVVAGLCLAGGLALAAWHQSSKPTILTLAVGPAEFDDAKLVAAWSRALAADGAPVRLSVILTSGPVEALARLAKGEAQLAVIRSDGAASEKARAVAILHKDPVVIVTPNKTRVGDFADLNGKVLGVIGPPNANDRLLTTLQRHYRVSVETRPLPPVPVEITSAIRDRKVDALLFVVPTTRGPTVRENWAAVRRASHRNLSFLEIDQAEAIAAAEPAYEAGEIAAGQFGGSPALPEESITTLEVATYLVADRTISDDTITQLTRNLFDERQKLAADAPIARLVQTASTDKDAIIPVHPGAKVFYDGEETTLMERYGDWVWYGPALLGALGSVLAVILRFLGLSQIPDAPAILSRAREIISSIEQAGTLAELDKIRGTVDETVGRIATEAARGSINEQQAAVIHLAVSYIDHALATRRDELLRGSGSSPGRADARDMGSRGRQQA